MPSFACTRLSLPLSLINIMLILTQSAVLCKYKHEICGKNFTFPLSESLFSICEIFANYIDNLPIQKYTYLQINRKFRK